MAPEAEVKVQSAPLSAERQQWLRRAWAEIDEERLARLNLRMTEIPSPTGEERALAEFLVSYMDQAGLSAFYQPIAGTQGNAIGQFSGSGGGPELLLYSPIDTAFSGREDEDCPGVGPVVPVEMTCAARIEHGSVIGLGAENPKGYATCVVAAAEAIGRAQVPLRGRLTVGLGAGGMPTNRRPSVSRSDIGHGIGCAFMLEQGVRGDFAIIAKPGYSVAWEEVGLCWFKIQVRGALGYTGVRHRIDYKNPVVASAKLISALEEWFPEYTRRNSSGLVAPQGAVNAIEAGWSYKPAFNPAVSTVYVDLRISPRTDPTDAQRQFAAAMDHIRKSHPGLDMDWEMILAVPGGHTDPDNWIIQSCIRAWEYVEGRPHEPRTATSGATDADILRNRGIPTARIGMPRAKDQGSKSRAIFSMEACPIAGMRELTKCLVYGIIDTCTRERKEVGLTE